LIKPGKRACSPRSIILWPEYCAETSGNFPTSTTEPAGAKRHGRAAREGDEPGGEPSIRSPETATAPLLIGAPSIVTTTRARTIISLLRLSGTRTPKDCTAPGREAESSSESRCPQYFYR